VDSRRAGLTARLLIAPSRAWDTLQPLHRRWREPGR
jgi:hypothetical protein